MSGIRYDVENQLSANQAFTGVATVSTHSYKKGSAKQDLSIGRRMALAVIPKVNAGTGSTVQIEVIEADDGALTSGVVSLGSVSVLATKFVVGANPIEVPIPQGVMGKLYVGARVTITGGTTTATMDIYLMPQDDLVAYKSFPKVNNAIVQ